MRPKLPRGIIPLIALLLLAGCGSKGPNTPTPTVSSVTVNLPNTLVLIGATASATATATLSNGATETVTTTGVWSSSNPSIASVTSVGVISGAGSGETEIHLDYVGRRGTVRVTVRPNYHGNWIGSYVVDSCSETGAAVGTCAASFSNGRVLPLQFQFVQNAQATTVTGRTALGQVLSDEFSTAIGSDGVLQILARAPQGVLSFTEGWTLQSTTAGRITGKVQFIIRDDALVGSVTVNGTLINTNREGSAATLASRPAPAARSIAELVAAIVGRD